ncbi:MAG: 16S rRNA (guanine(966)-N(2))-methyltransferase RsmD [Schwartzia sp.]|nr:16S rRNA (guanine(966)-N(2))-methyltransferase RsmD [Schwartzia sp. (in: firmicutes)]
MRIITGKARGARLKAPKGLSTRPTSDRVKESLFSILGGRVVGRRVLDLFAGTGSLGLEALSRGASFAVLVDRATGNLLRDNAEHTRLAASARVMRGDVFASLSRLAAEGERFDLVFCDPPYAKGLWERTLAMLDTSPVLSEGALVVAECGGDERTVPPLSRLSLSREEHYGHTTLVRIFAAREDGV